MNNGINVNNNDNNEKILDTDKCHQLQNTFLKLNSQMLHRDFNDKDLYF